MRWLLFALAGCLGLLMGCSAAYGPGSKGTDCDIWTVLRVSPSSATADHAAEPPGNQQQFSSSIAPTAPPGCPVPQWIALAHPVWTSSDPVNISISSANDETNGLAVCKGTTNGPATLTATTSFDNSTETATATLTCK